MTLGGAQTEIQAEAPARDGGRACLLNVERSITGRRWELRAGDERLALALSQRLGLPELVGRVLAARGVSLEAAEGFLAPSLRVDLPNPSVLRDMDEAAERLAQAVMGQECIAVFGDYDVDGATSSALLGRFLQSVRAPVRLYIPDRISEGYGPNAPALLRLKAEGAAVVVTVDCGITAHEPLAVAAEAGLDVIVVDHHAAEPKLPPAVAVVNPNRLDDVSGLGQLAAVGVAFLLVVAVNRHLREAGWYGRNRQEPNLLEWLDLVALGTICDVVPLTGPNRAFVTQGLKVMARRRNPGLVALGDVAKLDEPPGAYHAGFLLGPRVNAGGRVGEAGLGARLLGCDDPAEALEIAQRLDAYNAERRRIEAEVLDEAIEQVESGPAPDALVFAAGHAWHPGVIGIVASRLKERYGLPAMVVALDEEGLGKGSGRSVTGVDLGSAVIAARQAGLLVNGGGHPMAAGLTLEAARLEELRSFLASRLALALAAAAYQPVLGFDGTLSLGGASFELFGMLQRVGPFGTANPEPRFALPEVFIERADVVGQGHVRCRLRAGGGTRLKGIAFRAMDGDLGPALLQTGGLPLHIAGKLRADTWSGPQALQFVIEDAAKP